MSIITERWHEYDYAIVRVVPRVQLGTFVNVGVILHARTASYLGARIANDVDRILHYAPPRLDVELLGKHLESFVGLCEGIDHGTLLDSLPKSERFHWLTAPRSAVIQTSELHSGRTKNPETCLQCLFEAMILEPLEGSRAASGCR